MVFGAAGRHGRCDVVRPRDLAPRARPARSLGRRGAADEIFRVRIDRLRKRGEHASLVTLFQYQARMARLVGDREALAEALQSMRDAALTSGLPAVILLADRVAELRSKHRSSPLPPAS